MTVSTPRFGPKLDPGEHGDHMKNFEAEMYSFADDKRERDRYMNILHLSTDLDATRPEMDRIVRRMVKWGYGVEHKTGFGLSDDRGMILAGIDTDILILGSDEARFVSAYYILRCVSIGWFGIVPYWDMLWYGMDYKPEPPAQWAIQHHMGPSALPLFSGRKLALDAVCLVHAHIRRRHDRSALSGAYVEMMRDIEGRINELVKGAWKIRNADKRIEKFKAKVVNDGHDGPDVELFFAALDVLRNHRNLGAHMTKGLPPAVVEKKRRRGDALMANFDRLANTHRRPLWPPIASSKADSHFTTKWESSLAHMAVVWLEEYSKLSAGPQAA